MVKRLIFISKVMIGAMALSMLVGMQQGPSSPSEPSRSRVLVLPISDEGKYMVDEVQAQFILDTLEHVDASNYDRVILKIDTFGGVVFSAREITERLLRLGVPTTAYVETKAISAGAFIAWACDDIVMEALTTIGDAQMVFMNAEGKMEEAPEKSVSVYRSDWEKASKAKNRSFALARGFFESKQVVYQVGDSSSWDFMLKTDYEALPEGQRPPIMDVVVDEGQLLTLHAEKAQALGIASVVASFGEYLQSIGTSEQEVDAINMGWNHKILRYLSVHSWIFFVITLIGLNGIYAEIKAPGFGIPGLTALVCFTIVFGARYLLGTAEIFEVLLFIAGIALCAIEIFVTPGVGVVGITGFLMMLGALMLSAVPEMDGLPKTDIQWSLLTQSSAMTLATFLGSLVTMAVFFPMLFKTRLAQRHMLPNEMRPEDGYIVNTTAGEKVLKGLTGTAHGGLRPSGKMKLGDGRLLDVLSDGQFIASGQAVRIHRVEGNRIIVRPIDGNSSGEV